MTTTGHAIGTPAYMAPEQASGNLDQIGPGTDIYALGVILYELLTSRTPFQGHDTIGTLLAVMETEPDSPRLHRPDIPRDLETICLKCLMKSPADRYASAADLATDLALFLAGEPILASRPGIMQRIARWARHSPRLAVCYLSCIACYGLHLVAKYVLNLPFHRSEFATYAPVLVASWGIAATLSEVLARRYQSSELGQYSLIGITATAMTFGFSLDQGPQSAPVPMLFVLIACSILFVPTTTMVWFVTTACSVSYLALSFNAYYYTQRGVVSIEQASGFVISLIMMGVCTYLVMRRAANRTIRDNQWETV